MGVGPDNHLSFLRVGPSPSPVAVSPASQNSKAPLYPSPSISPYPNGSPDQMSGPSGKIDQPPTNVPPPAYTILDPVFDQHGFPASIPETQEGTQAFPPDYFNVSIVPNERVLFPTTAPVLESPSEATFKQSNEGHIKSFDKILEFNPDQVWRFFATHLKQQPGLHVCLKGQHVEHYYVHHTTHSNGHSHSRTERRSRTVTDFACSFDVSHYVLPQWTRIVSLPTKQGGSWSTIRQTIEEFTQSHKTFKKMSVKKQILWDYPSLTASLHQLIRSTGYPHSIYIEYKMVYDKISVCSSNTLAKASENTCVRALCVISCLCIIFWPIYAAMRKNIDQKIVAEFVMSRTAEDFFRTNYMNIFMAVSSRQVQWNAFQAA